MYVVTTLFTARPAGVRTFKSRVVQLAAETLRHEPACRTFDVCFDPDDELTVFLYRVFETPEDFLAHLDSDHARAFQAEAEDWLSESHERSLRRL